MQAQLFKEVLTLEAEALTKAREKVDQEQLDRLGQVFDLLIQSDGAIIFCGVGKSGWIANKLSSTFASLGRRSFFLHPTEALHGDLGRISNRDAVVFISNSGSTEEIVKLIPFLDISPEQRIGLLGKPHSPIGEKCGVVFDCSVEKEACLNNQAPTTSSTLAMAMGDAMAVCYEQKVGLSKEGFAVNHPGGLLGKTLRMKVRDLMWPSVDCPTLEENKTLKDVILAMTQKNVGGCAFVDHHHNLLGLMVEGDIRRSFTKDNQGLDTPVSQLMIRGPITVRPDELASHALQLMEERQNQIDILPVVEEGKFLGFLRLHDLVKEGFKTKR